MEKRRCIRCQCLHDNVLLESFVIMLTLISGAAITGNNLFRYDLITVPRHDELSVSSTNVTSILPAHPLFHENEDVVNLLDKIFVYISLTIATVFALEILVKVVTLWASFIVQPWQIFDGIVVVCTLGVEIAFYFLTFNELGIYSIRYIVMLRLWRIPFVCTIHSKVLQQYLEQDVENFKLKFEEKMKSMQTTIAQQNERISFLQSKAGKNENKLLHNSSLNIDDTLQTRNVEKTDFSQIKSHDPLSDSVLLTQAVPSGKTTKEKSTVHNAAETSFSNSKLSEYEHFGVSKISRSEGSYDLKTVAEGSNSATESTQNHWSSESHNVNLTSKSIEERNRTLTNRESKSNISSFNNSDYADQHNNEHDNACVEETLSLASDSQSESSNIADSLTRRNFARQIRLSSCPEYIFTQRMSITEDESKLISDNYLMDDNAIYDNMAFLTDEHIGMQILAEFDGVKTYCNENGIPMTSL